MSIILAMEAKRYDTRVNAIVPGAIALGLDRGDAHLDRTPAVQVGAVGHALAQAARIAEEVGAEEEGARARQGSGGQGGGSRGADGVVEQGRRLPALQVDGTHRRPLLRGREEARHGGGC